MRLLQSGGTFTNHSQCAKGDPVGKDHRESAWMTLLCDTVSERFPPQDKQVVRVEGHLCDWMVTLTCWVKCGHESVDGWSSWALAWNGAGVHVSQDGHICVSSYFRALPTHG